MHARLDEIHPGEILKEDFMIPLGLTTNELATALQLPALQLDYLLSGQASITEALAASLSKYFETSTQFWLNLQREYDARMAVNGGKQ